MSEDDAISGESGGYVPCDDLPASPVAVDADGNAIAGGDEGRVPSGQSPHAESSGDETSAMSGATVGYVANPCEECGGDFLVAQDIDRYTSYIIRRTLSATSLGGETTIESDANLGTTGRLAGFWSSYDISSGGDQGGQEIEDRVFINYLVPDGTTRVRIYGTAIATFVVTDLETNGRPVDTDVLLQIETVSYDPDTAPDFDLAGSLLALVSVPIDGAVGATQSALDLDFNCSTIGDIIDIGDSNVWRLVQLMCRNVSPDGVGRHTWVAAPGHATEDRIEIIDRFPNNPDWHRAGHPLGDYEDHSSVQSSGVTDLTLDAYSVTEPPCDIFDDFDRITSNGLGTSTSGLTWTRYLGAFDSAFSTDGVQGIITPVGPFYEAGAEIFPPTAHAELNITARVVGPSSAPNRCFVAAEPGDFSDSVYVEIRTDGTILAATNFVDDTVSVGWSPAADFRIKIKIVDTNVEFTVWPKNTAEPLPILTLPWAGTTTLDGDIDVGAFGPVTAYFDKLRCAC